MTIFLIPNVFGNVKQDYEVFSTQCILLENHFSDQIWQTAQDALSEYSKTDFLAVFSWLYMLTSYDEKKWDGI